MDSNLHLLDQVTETALVLTPLDCAPRLSVILSSSVLVLLLFTVYVILKRRKIVEFLNDLYYLVYEVLCQDRHSRYMSCMLSLSSIVSVLFALFSARPGGCLFFLYASCCLQMLFAFVRIIQIWNAYRYPSDELDVGWNSYKYLPSSKLQDILNLPPDKFEEVTAEWKRRTQEILLSRRTPLLHLSPKIQSQLESSTRKRARKKKKFYI